MSLKMKQRFLLEKKMLIFIAIFVFTRIKFPSYLNDSQISVAFVCHFPKCQCGLLVHSGGEEMFHVALHLQVSFGSILFRRRNIGERQMRIVTV